MRVTRREHAALILEESGKSLVIDPGGFTLPLEDLGDVVGVVITHEHPDHWTAEHLNRLLRSDKKIAIYGPEGVAKAAVGFDVQVVHPGDTVDLDPFRLEFFGGEHALIHKTVPIVDNVGVLVNDVFYYPGDSYAVPRGKKVQLLAAPIGGPWLKVGDAMDFVLAVAPHRAFGTHDAPLSQIGKSFLHPRLAWATEQGGGEYLPLEWGESVVLVAIRRRDRSPAGSPARRAPGRRRRRRT